MSIMSPDCRDDKHAACVGDAWDQPNDCPALCACSCHPPIEQMPAEVGERIRANVMAEVRRPPHPVNVGGWDPGAAMVVHPDGDLTYGEYALIWIVALVAAALAVMFG